jgi:hypothetical protein
MLGNSVENGVSYEDVALIISKNNVTLDRFDRVTLILI